MKLRLLLEKTETYVQELLAGRRYNRRDKALLAVLFLLSGVYKRLVIWRLSLYRHRLLRDHRLGCLVISVGNLSVGGTGKTPVVEIFARTLAARGRRVAVLSRGYRSKSKPFLRSLTDFFRRQEEIPPRVVSKGDGPLLDSYVAGDEPYMLAKNLEDVVILVDKDRVKSGKYAIRTHDCDTLILDDGFQYLPLKPRVNLLLIDSTNCFDNHFLLPRGLLREPIRNLRRADYVILTKSNGGAHLRHLKSFIKRHNPRAEIIECCHHPLYLQDVHSADQQALDYLDGKNVASICGIAQPESFERFLHGFGANLVYLKRYADHHRYTRSEISAFLDQARKHGAELVLTTEKDAVRIPRTVDQPMPILFMRVEIDILSGHENFAQCVDHICFSRLDRNAGRPPNGPVNGNGWVNGDGAQTQGANGAQP